MIQSHLCSVDKSIGDCTFRDVLQGHLKMPIFQLTVTQGKTCLFGNASGILTVQGNRFLLDVLVYDPDASLRAMGFTQDRVESEPGQGSDEHGGEGKITRFVIRGPKVGEMITSDSGGYILRGTTLLNERFSSATVEASSNSHIEGQVHWTARLQYFRLEKDETPSFDALVRRSLLDKVPRGQNPKSVALLVGRYDRGIPSSFQFTDQGCSVSRKELNPDLTILEVAGGASAEERLEVIDLVHEALNFVNAQYCHLIGYASECGHASEVVLWSDGLQKHPTKSLPPVETKWASEETTSVVNLFLEYFAHKNRGRLSIRQAIVRQILSADNYHSVQEFVLCTAIEGVATLLDDSEKTPKYKHFSKLKQHLKSHLLELQSDRIGEIGGEPSLCEKDAQDNISRLLGQVPGIRFKNAIEQPKTVLKKNGIPWNDDFATSWGKLRNPALHGEDRVLDQARLNHFYTLVELWYLLILGEIGYEGTIIRYGARNPGYQFPRTHIKSEPTHLG